MSNSIYNKWIIKVVLIICCITLQSLTLSAQIRTRTVNDSIIARNAHTWYDASKYQFEVAYPKLSVIPPLSTGMDFETLLSYILADSLMRSTTRESLTSHVKYWKKQKVKNDTIIAAIKYLYKLKDYDPIRFYQYMHSLDSPLYSINLLKLHSSVAEVLSRIVTNTPNAFAINQLFEADYILKVHVNFIDSLPWINHPNQYIYQVNATVLDTLKGRVFQSCGIENLSIKKSNKQLAPTTASNTLCFTYVTGPYSNDVDNYKVDESLLNGAGNLSLQPSQEVIVSLSHGNYLWDYGYDYFGLSISRVTPIINGQVKDNNNEWSNSLLLNYADWKSAFLQKKNMLLTGGY
ncbi:MAG: hypothetical protein U0264_13125 [Candidatus Kapaibacterium sp.]